MKTFSIGEQKLVALAESAYMFSVQAVSEYPEIENGSTGEITNVFPLTVNGYQVVPEGANNNIPDQTRLLLEDNNLGEGILKRKLGLHLGQGFGLYHEIMKEGYKQRVYETDNDIDGWLDSWDFENYIIDTLTDFLHIPLYYSKVFLNKGARIGNRAKVAKLEHVPSHTCRREWPDASGRTNNILVGDWEYYNGYQFAVYPVFDRENPFSKGVSIAFNKLHQFGRNNKQAVIPQFYGAKKWMALADNVPEIITNLNKNMLNIKWHITSPKSYWDNKREMLMKQCEANGVPYKEVLLENLKDDILTGLSKVLSGIQNVGKFFHSESVLEVLDIGKTQLQEWKIESIDMKVKDYIDAQLNVGRMADSATTSGMGLHPSLSNIMVDGKLASGSEQLYAYKLFMATDQWLVEKNTFEVINQVIKINFPGKKLKLGFYNDIVKREAEVAPKDRVMENNN